MHPKYIAAVADLKVRLENSRKEVQKYTMALAKAKVLEENYVRCLNLPENNIYENSRNRGAIHSSDCPITGNTIFGIQFNLDLAQRMFDGLNYAVNNLHTFPPMYYRVADCAKTEGGDIFLYHPKCEEYRASHTPEAIKAKTLEKRAKFDDSFPWAIGTDQDPFKSSRIDPKTIKPEPNTNKNKPAKPKDRTTPGKKPISTLKK